MRKFTKKGKYWYCSRDGCKTLQSRKGVRYCKKCDDYAIKESFQARVWYVIDKSISEMANQFAKDMYSDYGMPVELGSEHGFTYGQQRNKSGL